MHFANCEANSSYCNFKVVNGTEIVKQFFSQGKFISSKLYFPNHILILFVHCILLSKEILLILKITPKHAKKFLNSKKNIFGCSWVKSSLCSECLLRSEFQTIIRALKYFPLNYEVHLQNCSQRRLSKYKLVCYTFILYFDINFQIISFPSKSTKT